MRHAAALTRTLNAADGWNRSEHRFLLRAV